jgi:hypothetical protein
MSFDIGDEVLLTWPLTDTAGTPQDATTVVLTVTAPDGTISTPTVAHPSTGTYTATVTPGSAGMWGFRWQATGSGVAAEDGAFLVRRQGSNVVPLQMVKDRLNKTLPSVPGDNEIQDMIDAALAEYEEFVGPVSGTVTETFDGGGTTLVLRQPVNAITAAAYDSGDTLTYTDLTVSNGIVRWGYGTAGRFNYGRVSITYDAPTLPANHREVIAADVAGYFAATQRGSTGPALPDQGYADVYTGHPVELFPRIRALAKQYPVVA